MFTYNVLIEACNNLGLDPIKKGDSPLMNSHPVNTFEKPFNLGQIKFPEKEMIQVIGIGKIVWNLISQVSFPPRYDSSKESKEAFLRDTAIKKILPIVNESLNFWLEKGLEKCNSTKELIIHNGKVYEINPEYPKSMNKFDERMEEIGRESRRKLNASWHDARNVMLD